jgi:predicted ATP-dependent endonuclease of OLD family
MIKLISIEIENYRSIVGTPLKLEFSNFTSIVGPNNCGKSNILRALQLFFTGQVDGYPYTSDFDYPKNSAVSNKAQTKITVTLSYGPAKDIYIQKSLTELEAGSDQIRLDDDLISMRLSYSKNGAESWQFLGKKGARNIKKELIAKVRESVRRSVAFKYIPVGRDSAADITEEIGLELIGTIFSGWSGAAKQRSEINDSIATMLQTLKPSLAASSTAVTNSMASVFNEIKNLELQLPFSNLEEMLPNLKPVLRDTAETGLRSKGAGIQTSSLLFLLKYLADNYPKHQYTRKTFIWAIEEPESFLHPTKQRAMAEVLLNFSSEVQTLITTHCPHFVPKKSAVARCYIVDKSNEKPWSTEVVGSNYELARQTLGVTLLDSMSLYPVNIVVEGPSDEIYLSGAAQKLGDTISLNPYEIKFFPAGNATSASYMYEWIRSVCDDSTCVKLIIDGDPAGKGALQGLLGRAKRDNISLKANQDYFQLPLDIENMLSDKVKRILEKERPAQVTVTYDMNDKITSFKANDTYKKSVAARAIELSELADLKSFQVLLEKIYAAVTK